jgi:hypothetical protein
MTATRCALAGILIVLLGLTGCKSGPKTYKVTGKVTKGGKALEVKPIIGRVRVVFDPMDAELKTKVGTYDAVIQTDGTYVVHGNENKGIPAGKYRIQIYQYDPFPTDDKLKGQFGEGKTPYVREVKPDATHFEFELDKPS